VNSWLDLPPQQSDSLAFLFHHELSFHTQI
jgi:hypothetical protein